MPQPSSPATAPVAHAGTSAVDLMAIAFAGLAAQEQDEALGRLQRMRVDREAGEESETGRFLASLLRAAEVAGRTPTPDDYKQARVVLAEEGVELEPYSRVIRHFGSWRLAREAVGLAEVTTARRIESRFRSRRLGKVWRYTDQTLRETVVRCAGELGRVPLVAEFEWWRQRELELARATEDDALHLPSPTPYRRRWGSWEGALHHFGFTEAAIKKRLGGPGA